MAWLWVVVVLFISVLGGRLAAAVFWVIRGSVVLRGPQLVVAGSIGLAMGMAWDGLWGA